MFSGMITWDPKKTGKRETFKVPPRLQIAVGGREHSLGCSPVCGPESGAGGGLYGFGSPAQATLTLQSCRGETPASPHPQGSRPVPWTSGHLHTCLVPKGLNHGRWEGFLEGSCLPLSPLRPR